MVSRLVNAYRTPDERFASLPHFPFAPHYVDQDGLRLHYVDEGAGDPVLLLHGEPTWSFLYRKMIPILATDFRVIAPDYFGFGRSDKPVEPDFYSYDRHAKSIRRLVETLDLSAGRDPGPVQSLRGRPGLRRANRDAAGRRASGTRDAARDHEHGR